ncbi:NAD-dependent succinate-semialdehyde dehydrogenase [Microbacterium sp. GXF7504]
MVIDIDAALRHAPTGVFIRNEFRDASDGGRFGVTDPATGEILTEMADATVDDAMDALDAATSAQADWAATAPRRRADILRRAYELLIERREPLALLMTLEMGKPLAESEAEITYGADFLRWFAEEAVRVSGQTSTSPSGESRILTLRQPVGPCLLVTPWNFPLAMGTRKLGPALAAGCTVVIKPATPTPLTMNALAAILVEAGVPAGVVSVIPTTASVETVAALMADGRLRKISFTGSTHVGRQLIRQSADQVLRLSMELGGNAPFIVCPDADLDRAADEAMKAKLRNNGEACTAANVFYVHADVVDDFTAALAERFRALVVGPGSDPASTVGPLIDEHAVDRIRGLVADATDRGASVVASVPVPADGLGAYFSPTLLRDVPADARIVREEIFGPVAPVVTWHDRAELIDQVNASEYGLASYLFTRDLHGAAALVEALHVGMVGVNRGVLSDVAAPFGGIKHSGYGREGGAVGIDEYLETKYVALDAGW